MLLTSSGGRQDKLLWSLGEGAGGVLWKLARVDGKGRLMCLSAESACAWRDCSGRVCTTA
jgi:hypothetical protein